ncbi:M23 family metallopeptidase [Paenibacillus zeirhizosphaerae]|uniref:M23 family metallopeptidase n=1 Tax=Paenibacillus zeirhizosphaerae TaxID=2987519 RepID=UPI002737A9F6|nr:M23 family metallopeptidase [Paenibacillus sp. P96]
MKGFKGTPLNGGESGGGASGEQTIGHEEREGRKRFTFDVRQWRNGLNSPRKWAVAVAGSIIVVGGIIFAGNQYVAANTVPYYKVYVKGTEVGALQSEDQLQKLYKTKAQEYAEKYPDVEMALNTEGISTKVEKAYKADIDSNATLSKLDSMLTAHAKGVEVVVDGEVIGIVKDTETAQAVLKQVQKQYMPDSEGTTGIQSSAKKTSTGASAATPKTWLTSVGINEDIDLEPVEADPNKVLTEDEAVQTLMKEREEPVTYVVREGDTLSTIAGKFEMTAWEIKQNNSGTKEKYLQIGDELKITAPKPPVTVKTVEKVVEQINIEPEKIIRESDELKAGTTKVVRPGQAGLKRMDYQITKENGEVVKEEWLGQEVLKASVPEVVLRGTKVIGQGTGDFAWPVSGASLTSSYGSRWGRMHEGVDMVGSRDVQASDEGKVSFAGTQNGYGNVIVIDHGNSYQTVYGHLSSIGVSVGQTVSKGQSIGVMGSTGRSTGTHLHFEIRKNNSAQNPLTYLR